MTVLKTNIASFPRTQGKVRDIYNIGPDVPGGRNRLVIVTTDRISAFDHILPTPIPRKGEVLTQLTKFWLSKLGVKNHFITDDTRKMPSEFHTPEFEGRTMMVTETKPVKYECVVRGYLCGSGWADYRKTGAVCGVELPPAMQENMAMPEPIFTPATKAETGHDINVSVSTMEDDVGTIRTHTLWKESVRIYQQAAKYAFNRGIIIADTKFEWGVLPDGSEILIDEVLTSDSSRFWDISSYRLGSSPPSFDKQYVRDYLSGCGWDKESSPPPLPDEVVNKTTEKYLEAYHRLTGKRLT